MQTGFVSFRRRLQFSLLHGTVTVDSQSGGYHYAIFVCTQQLHVRDLDRSLSFYKEALGLTESSRINAPDGSFIIVYLTDGVTPHLLELTWLRDWDKPYNLGDNEFHLPSAWMISMPHTQSTRKWTASALKSGQWAFILSPTRTATGWRSFPQSKQKTLGAAALSVFFILLTGLFCSFFDSGCILLKLSPDERTVSFESLP